MTEGHSRQGKGFRFPSSPGNQDVALLLSALCLCSLLCFAGCSKQTQSTEVEDGAAPGPVESKPESSRETVSLESLEELSVRLEMSDFEEAVRSEFLQRMAESSRAEQIEVAAKMLEGYHQNRESDLVAAASYLTLYKDIQVMSQGVAPGLREYNPPKICWDLMNGLLEGGDGPRTQRLILALSPHTTEDERAIIRKQLIANFHKVNDQNPDIGDVFKSLYYELENVTPVSALKAAPSQGKSEVLELIGGLGEDLDDSGLRSSIFEQYDALNSEDRGAVRDELQRLYFEWIADRTEGARAYRDLYAELVNRDPDLKEPFSLVIAAQQPHATAEIRPFHKGVPSQLATSQLMLDIDSDIIKLAMTKRHLDRQELDADGYDSCLEFAQHPLYKQILDLPYRVAFFWAHGDSVNWGRVKKSGFAEADREALYDEFYAFTEYLLTHYNRSGKTFMIGNWEGDWLLTNFGYEKHLDADEQAIASMIEWFNIRHQAIADASRDTPHEEVAVYSYVELNHVNLVRQNGVKRIVNSVLPYVRTDYVSVSSYDMQNLANMRRFSREDDLQQHIFDCLDFVESHLPPGDIPGKRVFIGEIGYTVYDIMRSAGYSREQAENEQARLAMLNARLNLEWGMPFWLWWAVHDNEHINGSTEFRGFGLIDQVNGKNRRIHEAFEDYYQWAVDFETDYERRNQQELDLTSFLPHAIEKIQSLEKKYERRL